MKDDTPIYKRFLQEWPMLTGIAAVYFVTAFLAITDPLNLNNKQRPTPPQSGIPLSDPNHSGGLEELLSDAMIPLSRDGKEGRIWIYTSAGKQKLEILLPYIDPQRSDSVKEGITGLVYEIIFYRDNLIATKPLLDEEANIIYTSIREKILADLRQLPKDKKDSLGLYLGDFRSIEIIDHVRDIVGDDVMRLQMICDRIKFTKEDFRQRTYKL